MKKKYLILIGLVAVIFIAGSTIAVANSNKQKATLADTVRYATTQFNDVQVAKNAGYGLFHGCTSGQQEGSMGIHFANGNLVGDGKLDEQHPEVLLYGPKNGKLQLLGVEYLVFADAWNANNNAPPVLKGQLFNYVSAPNRYGLPALYELHVWAWENNPNGTFADWNPRVSCDDFIGDDSMPAMNH